MYVVFDTVTSSTLPVARRTDHDSDGTPVYLSWLSDMFISYRHAGQSLSTSTDIYRLLIRHLIVRMQSSFIYSIFHVLLNTRLLYQLEGLKEG